MNFKSGMLKLASASACLLVLGACNQGETPTQSPSPAAGNPASHPEAVQFAPEGRVATEAEVKRIMELQANSPSQETDAPPVHGETREPAPLAKTAALETCINDFNQSFGLGLMVNQCHSTFATSPYYIHKCNGWYWMYSTPIDLDHFHLTAEAPNQCYGTSPKWGTQSGANCINQTDAKYWPRYASNMGGKTGVAFYVKSQDNVRKNFNLGAIRVVYGTLEIYAYRVGVGWWYWNNLTEGKRWYFPSNNTNISDVKVFDSGKNGTVTWDNLEIAIIP